MLKINNVIEYEPDMRLCREVGRFLFWIEKGEEVAKHKSWHGVDHKQAFHPKCIKIK